ncbi:DUF3667 domain-containing protein [soil metagenome]
MNCINCGLEVTGRFCSQCGQGNPPRRITFSHLFEDFQASMFGFDGMLLRTVKDLTIHPGKVAKGFIEGNRVLYYKPVSYFLLVITVMLLISSLLGIDYIDYLKASTANSVDENPDVANFQKTIINKALDPISENLRLFTFLYIPVQAFFSRYLFFRKSGYSFVEHCVLPFYMWGHLYVTTLLSIIYFKITGNPVSVTLTALVYMLYFGYASLDMFTYQSKLKAFLKGVGIYLAIQILIVLVAMIATVIALLLSPELMNQFKSPGK